MQHTWNCLDCMKSMVKMPLPIYNKKQRFYAAKIDREVISITMWKLLLLYTVMRASQGVPPDMDASL